MSERRTPQANRQTSWISPPPGLKSRADWIASLDRKTAKAFWDGLSPNAVLSALWTFELWSRPDHQDPPPGDWRTWVVLGGRGSGKTRAGAEWIRRQVEGAGPKDPGRSSRIALIAETVDQARDVMVLGESGLLSVTPPDRRPLFQVSRRRLIWPNGAEAQLFSAKDPESLRGPQFDAAWCDELGKWRRAQAAWDMLQFGLRLGERPQQVVTTTPRRNATLIELLQSSSTVRTSAPTRENAANLADGFLRQVEDRYGGTMLGRQELDGELLLDPPNALWNREDIEAARVKAAPGLDRIVVAVDPPATSHAGSDACGIVVVGAQFDGDERNARAFVLEDLSVQGASPQAWAERAVSAYQRLRADRIVAEVNQGGDMVEAVLRQVDPTVAYRAVRATRGKRLRAEPVAALYEQGRVSHVGSMAKLEDQMCGFARDGSSSAMTPLSTDRSPDRVDALVWAITDVLLTRGPAPRVRRL
ncbi:MAG: terminase family protein [Pseudomonadota bacterium]